MSKVDDILAGLNAAGLLTAGELLDVMEAGTSGFKRARIAQVACDRLAAVARDEADMALLLSGLSAGKLAKANGVSREAMDQRLARIRHGKPRPRGGVHRSNNNRQDP